MPCAFCCLRGSDTAVALCFLLPSRLKTLPFPCGPGDAGNPLHDLMQPPSDSLLAGPTARLYRLYSLYSKCIQSCANSGPNHLESGRHGGGVGAYAAGAHDCAQAPAGWVPAQLVDWAGPLTSPAPPSKSGAARPAAAAAVAAAAAAAAGMVVLVVAGGGLV